MKILVKGNIMAKSAVMSMQYPLEKYYQAAGDKNVAVNDSDFDLVIVGDLNIESICVMSSDVVVCATGCIMAGV